jgi:hypothetical protein
MDVSEEDRELGTRVSVHLIGEAFEALGYRFWCHEMDRKRHDCAIQKMSPKGGKYTPKQFTLEFTAGNGNGYVRVKWPDADIFSDRRHLLQDFVLADPDVTNQVVKAVLGK